MNTKKLGRCAGLVSLCALSACATSLHPIGTQGEIQTRTISNCEGGEIPLSTLLTPDQTDESLEALSWLSCELMAKSIVSFNSAQRLANRNEWRDIPVIGAALTIASLFVFGETDMAGNLNPGEVDVIEGIALGTAGFTLLSDYLNPEQVRTLLYRASYGYRCLAEHGYAIQGLRAVVLDPDRRANVNELQGHIASLQTLLSHQTPADQKEAAEASIERARRALSAFDNQRLALRMANTQLYHVAYDFGVDLTRSANRSADVSELESAIVERLNQMRTWEGLAAPNDEGGNRQLNPAVDPTVLSETEAVISETNQLLSGLPNIGLLSAAFSECTAKAKLDAELPRPQIRFVEIAD